MKGKYTVEIKHGGHNGINARQANFERSESYKLPVPPKPMEITFVLSVPFDRGLDILNKIEIFLNINGIIRG